MCTDGQGQGRDRRPWIIHALLTKGQAYVDQGQDYFEQRYWRRILHHLKRKAQQMGSELQPLTMAHRESVGIY